MQCKSAKYRGKTVTCGSMTIKVSLICDLTRMIADFTITGVSNLADFMKMVLPVTVHSIRERTRGIPAL